MKLKTILLGALAIASFTGAAAAQEVTLRLHQFLPPQANVPKLVLDKWAADVMEQSGGRIKVSFRSVGTVDVAELARRFGGGGHTKAAGVAIVGDMDSVQQQVLAAARDHGDLAAQRHHLFRGGAADPGRCAGDDDMLACQIHHLPPSAIAAHLSAFG